MRFNPAFLVFAICLLVKVQSDLLPSCPTGTYTNDKWMVAELGATCDTTCGSVGLSCDSAKQTALTNLAEDALVLAFEEAGFTCDKTGSQSAYGEGRDYAGAPFTVTISGETVCVGFKASSSAVSSCSANEYSNHRPFCRCVVTVGQETCIDPTSCTTDPKLTAPTSSAYHIDGGGWRLVRRVAPSNNAWHPATDSLLGTASYGAATIDETADSTFSIPFTADASTEFLFAAGDAQKWLIATGAQIGGVFTNDYYSNSNRGFQLSSDGVRGLNAVVFGHDDMDMTGQMSRNMGARVYDFFDQSGFTIVTKLKWTASVYYENFFALKHADTSFYAAINRFGTNPYLYFGFTDSNGVGCGSPAVSGTHGISTSSNTWFLLKVVYTHATKTLCQYVDSVELCHTCPSNFVLPSTVTLENWLGGNLAANAAYSGEMAGFYTFTRPLTTEEQTIVADRIVVEAPDSVTSARWYNRAHVYNPEDPWISINDHTSSPNLMLYGENNVEVHSDFVMEHNGANVFVRTTYIYPEASFVFNPASTAEETFDGSRGDIQTSQSVPVTTDSDGWSVIFKIEFDSTAATWDALFDLNSDASNLGNIYATISASNTLRILVRNPGSSTTLCSLDSSAIFVPDVSHAVILTFSTESETLSMTIGSNAEVTTSCAGFVSRTYTALSIGTARQWNNAEWNGKIFGLYFFDSLVESNRAQELLECAASTVETSPCATTPLFNVASDFF